MKKFADKKEQAEAEFRSFMERSVWNCARNVTKKMTAEERRNSGVPIETGRFAPPAGTIRAVFQHGKMIGFFAFG